MLPIRTILVPTDFSEPSKYAFRLACGLARDYKARVVLLHVIPPVLTPYGGGLVPPADDFLASERRMDLEALAADHPDLTIIPRVEIGAPAEEILRVANEIKCELILMGTHGRTGFSRMLMGSVAEEVVRKAPCLVLTMKKPFNEVPAPPMASRETVKV